VVANVTIIEPLVVKTWKNRHLKIILNNYMNSLIEPQNFYSILLEKILQRPCKLLLLWLKDFFSPILTPLLLQICNVNYCKFYKGESTFKGTIGIIYYKTTWIFFWTFETPNYFDVVIYLINLWMNSIGKESLISWWKFFRSILVWRMEINSYKTKFSVYITMYHFEKLFLSKFLYF